LTDHRLEKTVKGVNFHPMETVETHNSFYRGGGRPNVT
jgi:hypothetical protein